MKKAVLKVDFYNDRIKQKVMKTASSLSGVESVSIDSKEKRLTLSGDIDPIKAVCKLRKLCQTAVSIGPLKEEKKESRNTNEVIPFQYFETYPYYYQMTPPQYFCDYYYV